MFLETYRTGKPPDREGSSSTSSDQTYRTLVEASRSGIALIDPESGEFLFCNEAYAKVFGLSSKSLTGKSLFEFLDAEEKGTLRLGDRSGLDGDDAGYDLTVVLSGGRKKRLLATDSPLFALDGSSVGTVHTILDVTERQEAQEALRESEGRFRATFENSGVGMAHVSPGGGWLRINARFCEMLGYSHRELLGLRFQDLTVPEELDASLTRVQRLIEGEAKSYSVDRRYIRKDGRRVWTSLSVTLERKPSGEPDYFTCVAEDITARKLRELVPDPLSDRELGVLRCLVDGRTNGQIARRLSHSIGTVKLDVQKILLKLGVKNRKQAATKAVEIGLIPQNKPINTESG